MKSRIIIALAGFLALPAAGAELSVVATVKPLHSLLAGVMEGVGTPALLIDGNASPHTFSLRPSGARMLSRADLIFAADPELEQFLEPAVSALAPTARVVALGPMTAAEQVVDPMGAEQDEHEADEHEADEHEADEHEADEHKADEHEAGGHEAAGHEAAGHEAGGHAHDHAAAELHAWLDPIRATRMVSVIADELALMDPANAAQYRDNAGRLVMSLVGLTSSIRVQLQPLSSIRFAVFHDAYGAFEQRFELQTPLALTLNPSISPGAETVSRLRNELTRGDIVCLFSEPQFDAAMVTRLVDGTAVKVAELDPLGATLDPGAAMYGQLLQQLADSLAGCLGPG